jgi:hypothetical protein
MLKYSEAIRLGAMLRPQAFNALYSDGATCANGAAFEAIGRLKVWPKGDAYLAERSFIHTEFPEADASATCPECDYADDLARTVVHLNNDHRWTRERIADFVAAKEAEAEAKAAKPAEECVAV